MYSGRQTTSISITLDEHNGNAGGGVSTAIIQCRNCLIDLPQTNKDTKHDMGTQNVPWRGPYSGVW